MPRLKSLEQLFWFIALGLLWLVSFRIADALTFFKTYSSIWFVPTGVTMAIVMTAPRWLKLAPLVANLLVAVPVVRSIMGVTVVNDYEPILHGLRLYAIYGGAGFILVRLIRIDLPSTSLRDYQWIAAITLVAGTLATASGIGMHMLAGNMTRANAESIVWSWWLGDAIAAFAVPPLLVPILLGVMGRDSGEWRWPPLRSWLEQIGLILLIFAFSASVFQLTSGTLGVWHLIIVPPLIFALRGGLPLSATCVFLTMATIPALAAILSMQDRLASLMPLLLTTTVAGLLLGAAMSDRNRVLNRLEELVDDRTQQLREAHEFQRHLIRSIGHDLRQPIEGINMVLEGMDRAGSGAVQTSSIRHARQIAALASQLLSTILTYARLHAGRIRVTREDFPAAQLFGSLDILFAPFAALKNVALVWPDTEEVLHSDQSLLGQALSNLIDNAIRLSEPGDTIVIGLERTTQTLAITISDSVLPAASAPGTAGFGLDIVEKIATLLEADFITAPNRKALLLRK